MISCSRSVMFLLDDGEPVFLLDSDGEAPGSFSRHNPERGERECITTNGYGSDSYYNGVGFVTPEKLKNKII